MAVHLTSGQKKPWEGEPQGKFSFRAVAEGVRVGIIISDYPKTALTNDQLGTLQMAMLQSVEKIQDDGPQVRFQGCTHRPGWLLITCADEASVAWLESLTTSLQPWDGARLKFVQGEDLPKAHIYVAYITDVTADKRLSSDKVLVRLRTMNHSLNTRKRKVLHREESGPGQTWTFSVDEAALKGLNNRPYFGFGQVQFRPIVKEEKGKPISNLPPTQSSAAKPPPKKGNQQMPFKGGEQPRVQVGKGKSLPNGPSFRKSGANPPSKKKVAKSQSSQPSTALPKPTPVPLLLRQPPLFPFLSQYHHT